VLTADAVTEPTTDRRGRRPTTVSAWYMRLGLPNALLLAIVLAAAVLVRTIVIPLIMALAIAIGISPHGQPPRILGLTRNLAAPVACSCSSAGEAPASSRPHCRLHSRKRSGRERAASDAAGNQTNDLAEGDVVCLGKHDVLGLDDGAEVFAVFAACAGIPELPGGGHA
jgi:hypothetical protein